LRLKIIQDRPLPARGVLWFSATISRNQTAGAWTRRTTAIILHT
jgi:hypothetical protein